MGEEQERGMKIDFKFVAFPREIWDQGIDLSHNGFRLLGYLLRHLVNFGNEEIKLIDDEILNGRKYKNGERMDKGSGIKSRNGLKEAREELETLGWISVETDASDKARIKRYYSIIIHSENKSNKEKDPNNDSSKNTVSKNDTLNSKNDKPNSSFTVSEKNNRVSKNETRVSENDSRVSKNDTRTNNKVFKDHEKDHVGEIRGEVSHSLDIPSAFVPPVSFVSSKEEEPKPTITKISETQQAEKNLKEPNTNNPNLGNSTLLQEVASLLRLNMQLYDGGWPRLAKETKSFVDIGITQEQIKKFGLFWYTVDWRGQKGETPTLKLVKQLWETAMDWELVNGLSNEKLSTEIAVIRPQLQQIPQLQLNQRVTNTQQNLQSVAIAFDEIDRLRAMRKEGQNNG